MCELFFTNACCVGPCYHVMAYPYLWVVHGGEETAIIWGVAVNILNKQLQTAENGRASSLGVGRGANNSP